MKYIAWQCWFKVTIINRWCLSGLVCGWQCLLDFAMTAQHTVSVCRQLSGTENASLRWQLTHAELQSVHSTQTNANVVCLCGAVEPVLFFSWLVHMKPVLCWWPCGSPVLIFPLLTVLLCYRLAHGACCQTSVLFTPAQLQVLNMELCEEAEAVLWSDQGGAM